VARSTLGADAAVRTYVLEAEIDFRALMSKTLDGYTIGDTSVFDHLSGRVNVLLDGGEVEVHRFELPDDHPARFRGNPCDYVVLGSDDVVRER
jgi:hypothetical protein